MAGAVSEAGGDPSVIQPLPAPSAADDARRKAEIQALLKSDRSAYVRDQNLQDELQQILQRESGESPRGAEVSVQGQQKIDASPNRRAEIETIMKSDRARYFKDASMQSEYRSLIAGEQGGAASEPVQTFASEGAADA